MDVRKMVLLVGALLIAGVTAMFARSMFAADGQPVRQAQAAPIVISGPQVLVARRALPVGTILSADIVAFQPWPKDMVDSAYFVKDQGVDLSKIPGQVVRIEIAAGQPVPQGALVAPTDRGFLAAALQPGMRAVSIAVNENTGVGGFVFPGDKVDLMLTQEVTGDGPSLRATETIARNVRVLAVDQTVDNTKNEPKIGRTVTVEVTPKLAEKIAVGSTAGQISLSLRSLSDDAANLDGAIASGRVQIGDHQTSKADRAMELALARMPDDRDTSATTGGEVSRFLRSTPPPRKPDADPSQPTTAGGPVPKPKNGVKVARGADVQTVATE